jgi:pSer/pThr/pTyr-binding forkhead associated (FHA) protein
VDIGFGLGGHEDHRNVRPSGLARTSSHSSGPVISRHHHVQKQEIGLHVDDGSTHRPGGALVQLERVDQLQGHARDFEDILVIIHVKYGLQFGHGPWCPEIGRVIRWRSFMPH